MMLRIQLDLTIKIALLVVYFTSICAYMDNCDAKDQVPPGLDSRFEEIERFKVIEFTCEIRGPRRNNNGNHTCTASRSESSVLFNKTMYIEVTEFDRVTEGNSEIGVNANESAAIVRCRIDRRSDPSDIIWVLKFEYGGMSLTNFRVIAYANESGISTTLTILIPMNDGSDGCQGSYSQVPSTPEAFSRIDLHTGSAIGSNSVYLTWHVSNLVPRRFRLLYRKRGTEQWYFYSEVPGSQDNKKIVTGLESDTAYQFKLFAISSMCDSPAAYSAWVTTLKKDEGLLSGPGVLPENHADGKLTCKISGASRNDSGNYTCETEGVPRGVFWIAGLHVLLEPGKITADEEEIDTQANKFATLSCSILQTCEQDKLTWLLKFENGDIDLTNSSIIAHVTDFSEIEKTLKLTRLVREDDGNYKCLAHYLVEPGHRPHEIDYIPTFWVEATTLDSITIGLSELPREIMHESITYKVDMTHGNKIVDSVSVDPGRLHTFERLEPRTDYEFTIGVCVGAVGGPHYHGVVKERASSMRRDINFVPTVEVKETSFESISIQWSTPPSELRDDVYHYKVSATPWRGKEELVYLPKTENTYVFENLKSRTSHVVKAAACSDYKTICGNWSQDQQALTIQTEKSNLPAIWSSVTVAILLLIVMIVWFNIRKQREMAARRRFIEATLARFNGGALDCLDPELNMAEQAELLPYNKKWEFPRELLKLGKVLGSGAFGIVRMAKAKSICPPEAVTTVAVKEVRSTASLDHMTALSRELKILAYLGKHLNVVNLLGACTKNVSFGQLFVIVEFCQFGNVHDYLLRRRADFVDQVEEVVENVITVDDDVTEADPLEPDPRSNYQGDYTDENLEPISTRDLLGWAWQVARGMKFLGSRRVLHGDLAARNIFLTGDNVVKICDFGMARALLTDDNYHKKGHDPLPFKWMAIESLRDRVFSVHSDIWSYINNQ